MIAGERTWLRNSTLTYGCAPNHHGQYVAQPHANAGDEPVLAVDICQNGSEEF